MNVLLPWAWALHLAIPVLGILLLALRRERQRVVSERQAFLRTLMIARGQTGRRSRR